MRWAVILGLMAFIAPSAAFAQTQVYNQLFNAYFATYDAGIRLPYSENAELFAPLINLLFSSLGIIFLVLILYAGFLWMTAGGNTDQVDKAKRLIVQAVIGLLVVLSAYTISIFILTQLSETTFA